MLYLPLVLMIVTNILVGVFMQVEDVSLHKQIVMVTLLVDLMHFHCVVV